MVAATRIVAGVANSAQAEAALDRAIREALRDQAHLILVGYLERPRGERAAEDYGQDRAALIAGIEERAAALRGRGLEVTVDVPAGISTPAESILMVAERERADLIVIGARRRSRVGKLILGSNVQDILLGADCPVLCVKAPEGDGAP